MPDAPRETPPTALRALQQRIIDHAAEHGITIVYPEPLPASSAIGDRLIREAVALGLLPEMPREEPADATR